MPTIGALTKKKGIFMESNVHLRSAFKGFLEDFPGNMWMTITFRGNLSEGTAKRHLKYFFKNLNTPQRKFFNKFVKLWTFYENNTGDSGVHIHALVDGINPKMIDALENRCRKVFGESKIVGKHDGVTKYLSHKYNSTNLRSFDFLKINSRIR